MSVDWDDPQWGGRVHVGCVGMHPNEGCVVCGCRLQGVQVGTFRVNKGSLRTTTDRGTLVFLKRHCLECGHPTPSRVYRWRLDAKSQQIVDEHRAKRGWS